MPYLSAFTPLGLLTLSSEKAMAEVFYEGMVRSLGDQFSTAPGSHMDAHLYAQAMALARAHLLLTLAGDEGDPSKVAYGIDAREKDYKIPPRADATLDERQRVLASRAKIPLGANQLAVVEALRELLGDRFVGYRPTPAGEAVLDPPNLGDQPMNLVDPQTDRRVIRALGFVDSGTHEVRFEVVDPDPPLPWEVVEIELNIFPGDKLVVEPETPGATEVVEVTSSRLIDLEIRFERAFTATFARAHPPGALMVTGSFPVWSSTKRSSLIFVAPEAARDAETRRKIDDLMGRIARGVSTWEVVEATPEGMAGPFILGQSLLGVTPFGEIPLNP